MLAATLAAGRERIRRGLSIGQLWAFVALALPVAATLRATLPTNDLAYGVRAGDLILGSHSLVRTDPLSFTAGGHPWVDQQWGSQVLLSLIYRAGGWATVALARALLVGLTFLLVYAACRTAGADRRRAAWLTLVSFLIPAMWPISYAPRPQLFAIVLFALTVWLLVGRHLHPARIWWLVPIVAIWASLHGSLFLGPLLVALVGVEDLAQRAPHWRRTFVIAGLSVLATALNPFGVMVWRYVFDLSTNPIVQKYSTEWQPPTIRNPIGIAFFVSLAAMAVLCSRRPQVPWTTLLTLGVFAGLGLLAQRNIVWWALVVPPIAVGRLGRRSETRTDDERSSLNLVIGGLVACLIIAFLPWWQTVGRSGSAQTLLSNAPGGLTSELASQLHPGQRMFNPEEWGSWFELALPGHPVFVDSRIEVFPPSVWRDYQAVSFAQQGWQQVLDRWHISMVVASRAEQSRLIPQIERDPEWRLAYQDSDGILFVRA